MRSSFIFLMFQDIALIPFLLALTNIYFGVKSNKDWNPPFAHCFYGARGSKITNKNLQYRSPNHQVLYFTSKIPRKLVLILVSVRENEFSGDGECSEWKIFTHRSINFSVWRTPCDDANRINFPVGSFARA